MAMQYAGSQAPSKQHRIASKNIRRILCHRSRYRVTEAGEWEDEGDAAFGAEDAVPVPESGGAQGLVRAV